MTPASSAPGGAWPSRIEAGRTTAPRRRRRRGRPARSAAPPRPMTWRPSSSHREWWRRSGGAGRSPGAVGAGSGRTRVGFWRPGRIVRADTPGGLGGFRMIPRFRWRYDRVRGGTILPGRHFSLRAGPRGLEREPDETHGAPGGRAPPGRPVFRERAGFQSNAHLPSARSTGNLRTRGRATGRVRPTVPSYPQDVHFPPVSRVVSAGFGERGGGQRVPGAVTKSMSSSMRPSRAGSRSL